MSFTRGNVIVPLPRVERATPMVLGGDPKGKTFLYTQDKSVICRDIENPLLGYTYNEHSVNTTVAKYSPSGFYIASGDVSGKLRIWDTTQAEHILKYEYRPLSGAIKDIAWSADSARLVVCGEGKEIFATAIMWDTGSTVGEITGHTKPINSVDFRADRPFRIATASEDNDSAFYAGPPFKLSHKNSDHSRFCQTVRFAPNGSVFVTGGADGKLFVYDGKEGKKIAELNGGGASAHEGGVYAVSWSADSKQLISASGDKTVKLWDVAANAAVTTFTFGDAIENQQLGCLWQGANMLSVSLNGFINYLDPANPSRPRRVLKGHNKAYSSLTVDRERNTAYAGSYDGRVSALNLSTGDFEVYGNAHTNRVVSAQLSDAGLVTAALDDTLRVTPLDAAALGAPVKLDSAPSDVATLGDVTVAACVGQVVVFRGGKKISSLPISFEAQSCSIHPSGTEVAVGAKDNKVHVLSLSGDVLKPSKVLDATGSVDALAYSPDGAYLAAGDSNRNVFVFDVAAGHQLKYDSWRFHSAKVTCLAWTPSSQQLASGSLDTNIIVWSLAKPETRVTIRAAHPMSSVNKVFWLTDNQLLSAGGDTALRAWGITHA